MENPYLQLTKDKPSDPLPPLSLVSFFPQDRHFKMYSQHFTSLVSVFLESTLDPLPLYLQSTKDGGFTGTFDVVPDYVHWTCMSSIKAFHNGRCQKTGVSHTLARKQPRWLVLASPCSCFAFTSNLDVLLSVCQFPLNYFVIRERLFFRTDY